MSSNEEIRGEPRGPIACMASNRVAANLLMPAIVAAGSALISHRVAALLRRVQPVVRNAG